MSPARLFTDKFGLIQVKVNIYLGFPEQLKKARKI